MMPILTILLGLDAKPQGCARLVLERLAQNTAATSQKSPWTSETQNIPALQTTERGMCQSGNLIELLAIGGANCMSLRPQGMLLQMVGKF